MTQLKANATDELGKVIYTAKTHTIGDAKMAFLAAPMAGSMSRFRRPAHRVSAPIRSSSLRPAGRRASKRDRARSSQAQGDVSEVAIDAEVHLHLAAAIIIP